MFWSILVVGALVAGNNTYQVQVLQLYTQNILYLHQDKRILSFQQLHLLLSPHLFSPSARKSLHLFNFQLNPFC